VSTRFKKTIVLGIDGFDPDVAGELIASGHLPNLARLAEYGTFSPLQPSLPPMSPVAWTDIGTGADSGNHGIFDFIHRRPENYMPFISMRKSATGLLGTVYKSPRSCDGFWRYASDAGVPTTIIRWPITFPPEKINGRLLSGLGTPDLLGREGRDTLYATTRPPAVKTELGEDHVVVVKWDGNTIHTQIEGPATGKNSFSTLDLTINRVGDQSVELVIQGVNAVKATTGQWTPYVSLEFKVGLRRLRAITRFLLIETEPELRLYQTAVQIDPTKPAFPITHPKEFSKELCSEIGQFSTLGMPETVHPVTKGWFGYDHLISLCESVDAERMKMFDLELSRLDKGLLAFVFDASDRMQHALWFTRDPQHPAYDEEKARQYADAIPSLYRRMDEAVGKAVDAVGNDGALWVVSDHGFNTYRRSVHLNRWLVENGYMHLKGDDNGHGGVLFQDVDWAQTKAYAIGFTSIYLNVSGREGQGIVASGEEQQRLAAEIAEKLQNLEDPVDGSSVMRKVYQSAEEYSGPLVAAGPDLIIGTNIGYRASWQTAIGGSPVELIEDNTDAWTGDHLFDPDLVPASLFSNQKINSEKPTAEDIAPTILTCIGVEPPPHLKGKSLI